jgi:hypothetical protein
MSRDGPYYSIRTGKNPNGGEFGLSTVLKLFKSLYSDLLEHDLFQEAFGYACVDMGEVNGTLGSDIDSVMMIELRKENLWPILNVCHAYSEEDLFDVIEFLYDHVSEGKEGRYHSYNDCGMHYETFDKKVGQQIYKTKINTLLRAYSKGFELNDNGEILALPEAGASHFGKKIEEYSFCEKG